MQNYVLLGTNNNGLGIDIKLQFGLLLRDLEARKIVHCPTLKASDIDPFFAVLSVEEDVGENCCSSNVKLEAVVVRVISIKQYNIVLLDSLDLRVSFLWVIRDFLDRSC